MVGDTVTLTATKTPAAAVTPVAWTSSDTKIATVKDGVVTGVAEGTATITAEADGKKAEAKITVTKKEIVATLVEAKQSSANTITIAFDIPEAKDVVAKNDIKITNVSANAVAGINTLVFDTTGKVATATLTAPLVDKAAYTVEYKGVSKDFIASVGDVASIAIETENAELNTATPVTFKLLDNTGMDVTPTVAVDSRVTITATGTSSESLTPASKATITLGNVGDKAEVTVTYDKGDGKSDLVTVTKTITCIPASAKVGTGIFYVTNDPKEIDNKSQCAKFYNGLKSNIVNTTVNGGVSKPVYFYADASADGAIEYDSYEVEPVDSDIASASLAKTEGKFCVFTVTGYTKGQTYIKVKATKNNASTEYQVPVTVSDYGTISKVNISGNNTLTNALDSRYNSVIEAEAIFTGGEKTDVTYKWEVTTTGLKDIAGGDVDPASLITPHGNKCTVNMQGVASAKYTVKVTATDANMKEATKTYDIINSKLSDDFWLGKDSASISYDLESSNTNFKVSSLSNDLPTYKVIAKAGGKFAGYVNLVASGNGNRGTIGTDSVGLTAGKVTSIVTGTAITPNAKFLIENLTNVISSSQKASYGFNVTTDLTGITTAYLYDERGSADASGTATIKLNPYDDLAPGTIHTVDFTKPSECTFVVGTYKVEFKYVIGTTEKVLSKSFTFTNDFAKPDVLPSSKTVKSGEEYKVYSSKYDLNADKGTHTVEDAITTVAGADVQVSNNTVATKALVVTNALTGATDVGYFVACNGGKITVE